MRDPTDQHPSLITKQPVSKAKMELAKTLRQEMTPEEKILWARVRKSRFAYLHFRRQQIIHGFIVDFYCHSARLVVEIDGDIHNQQIQYDHDRDQVFQELGLRVLHFSNREIHDELDQVLERIRQACSKRIDRQTT